MKEDTGNVIAEFIGVVIGLMIPMMFVVTSSWNFVETELALRTATESMARAYVISPNQQTAIQRSRAVLRIVLRDHAIAPTEVKSRIVCSQSPCLAAGSVVTVTLWRKTSVSVPGFGTRTMMQSQSHTSIVDQIR